MRSKLVLAVLAVLFCVGGASAYLSSTWYEDASGYEEAARQQVHQHVPMLVYFRTDWCPYCKKFDELLQDSKMREGLGPIIKVRVNPEHGDAERALFEKRFGAKGYPAIFWVAAEGASPRRVSAKGPPEEFLGRLTGN